MEAIVTFDGLRVIYIRMQMHSIWAMISILIILIQSTMTMVSTEITDIMRI